MRKARVAAHVHSNWSYDGSWPLVQIATAFSRRGYDAVLMSEHDRLFDEDRWMTYREACARASDDRIRLIPGIEYEDADNVVHVPVWGDEVHFLGAARPTGEILRDARDQGAVAIFAHPWRRQAFERFQSDWAPMLSGVEVWNRRYDGFAPHPQGPRFAESNGLATFVSLDFHLRREFFPLGMAVYLEGSLTATAIIDAVRQGHARPELLGMSALLFTHGAAALVLRGLELIRRSARFPVRAARRWPD